MKRLMIAAFGLGLTSAGVLVALSLEQRAEATREDLELVRRQQSQRQARHDEWVGLLEGYRQRLPKEYERQATFSQAAADTQRHLRLDLEEATLSLVEDGYVVRVSPVQIGESLPADGERPSAEIQVGRRIIDQRIRDGLFELPAWAGWKGERPKPKRKRSRRKRRRPLPKPIDGLYGARTLILDDGTIMYSTPGWGPWAAQDSVRPGGVEMTFTDMASIFGSMSTGGHIYVY
jgi:hypothetical protein